MDILLRIVFHDIGASMSAINLAGYALAVADFRRARRKAVLQTLLARLRGKPIELLPYQEVRRRLKGLETQARELREIPLDAIVGSVGRYRDFTRAFLPLSEVDEQRWAKVKLATDGLAGLPPIEVYQLGSAYFVQDGNHRVSVARQEGATHIQAYVRPVQSKVSISPEIDAEQLIVKAELADFLERFDLSEIRPQVDLSATVPGSYGLIAEQIEAMMHSRGSGEIQAAESWLDEIYLPFVGLIRDQGLQQDFPELTELDLFLWISRYRSELEGSLGWTIRPEMAVADLAARVSPRASQVISRVSNGLLDALKPDQFESGPPAGQWREQILASRRADRFAADILVPLSGEEESWLAMDQALLVAEREGARLLGLHIVPSAEQRSGPGPRSVKRQFESRCGAVEGSCELAIAPGSVARSICDRARWVDLIVLKLSYPPEDKTSSRLSSGFRVLVQRCTRPILAVPNSPSPMSKLLLAYDGSPKSNEALFLASYLADRWEIPIVAVTVSEDGVEAQELLSECEHYLARFALDFTLVAREGEVSGCILETAEGHGCDFITMGGYGMSAVKEVFLGSTVDQILRESDLPVLICR